MSNKLVAFFRKCKELNLPVDLCAFAYMELRNNSYTAEVFYSFFKDIYSEDEIFDYLKLMIENNLLIAFDDDNLGFDDTCFLALNIAYDPNINLAKELQNE
ncbi:hypothetical protein CBE90_04670 [Pasteurella multocida]|uniref:hypothetical protein n=1 Tax=Pasteurella multocida TaxID=747 RepID=UPI000CE810C6|nr:hypothetical protein [Pasteurella multocida]PPE94932.1 hypothetical protein CBE90_04670 [Pasteurella multocida]PPE95025.1 hypothetical protein CBE91_10195 [Pasteurella multocida]HDR1236508.1 hypothetical protein [Pasteurella multocida]HDR1500989.1 hypothetical protein [Pasteurella multocida]